MRYSLRFIAPLALVLAFIAYSVVPLVDSLTLKWFVRDLDMRGQLVFNSVYDALVTTLQSGSQKSMRTIFDRMIRDDRLFALGYCDQKGKLSYRTATFPQELTCKVILDKGTELPHTMTSSSGNLHVVSKRVDDPTITPGYLVMIHDMSFIQKRSADTRKYIFYFFTALGFVISLITVVIAQLSFRGLIQGMRGLLKGEGLLRPVSNIRSPELRPIAKELRRLVKELETDKLSRDANQVSWTPQALKHILQEELFGDEILIVSNREPYIHSHGDSGIEVKTPASGLVTALEPVMRACSGTWIAHGSGDADKDVVDRFDRVAVPPDKPSYNIRRVWLTKEEEAGYYYGFSNEGLWPLCHIAHTRPTFRSSDWEQYVKINERFAKAVIEEARSKDPVVWVQDYHFALLPRMIRRSLPDATIITFWHIPWPNPESFGICPWREEILAGMLGSSILGFHTQYHCLNFLESVDRFLEARIDREASTVSYRGKLTRVRNYPISVEWPLRRLSGLPDPSTSRKQILSTNQGCAETFGVGVDRLDYTKGILERLMAVERLFELYPEWIGKFSFIQIAAPSRDTIEQYKHFRSDVEALAGRINSRFGSTNYRPIILRIAHHQSQEIYAYYRASKLCLVTSLHDGMNLVAKEFVSTRDDLRGVLILSQFAGASKELPEALIVNPYDIDQCAHAIHLALTMDEQEQQDRMKSMRGLISEYNIYRWAGRMLMDASQMRERRRLLGRLHQVESSAEERWVG